MNIWFKIEGLIKYRPSSAPLQGRQDECPPYFFGHVTALKLCRWETEADHDKRLFSDQETDMNACFVTCEEQKQGIAETFPCLPDSADSARYTKRAACANLPRRARHRRVPPAGQALVLCNQIQ